MFCNKGVLRNFAKFTGKHLCQSLFIKKETLAQCFHVNFAKYLRTSFLTEHLWATASIITDLLELLFFSYPFTLKCLILKHLYYFSMDCHNHFPIPCNTRKLFIYFIVIKGTVMQIEKALIDDRLHVSKVF